LPPDSETNFWTPALSAEVTFIRTEKADVKSLTFRQEGRTFPPERKRWRTRPAIPLAAFGKERGR